MLHYPKDIRKFRFEAFLKVGNYSTLTFVDYSLHPGSFQQHNIHHISGANFVDHFHAIGYARKYGVFSV